MKKSKTWLQIVNIGLALLVLFLAGASFILGVDSPVYGDSPIPKIPSLDSNLRFFGGLGIGLALSLLWITPHIERHGLVYRIIWLTALLGGIGRLVSWYVAGTPVLPMIIFAIIEVPLVPLLIYWQKRVSDQYKTTYANGS